MNTQTLVADLKERNVHLVACGASLIVDAPTGVMTQPLLDAINACKPEILAALSGAESESSESRSPLIEYATSILPWIKFTVVETGDIERDFALLHRLRAVIREFQPGGNRVRMRIVTTDQWVVVVEWRAITARILRLEIARILAASSGAGGDRRRRNDDRTQ